jgi:hypothetical protein
LDLFALFDLPVIAFPSPEMLVCARPARRVAVSDPSFADI